MATASRCLIASALLAGVAGVMRPVLPPPRQPPVRTQQTLADDSFSNPVWPLPAVGVPLSSGFSIGPANFNVAVSPAADEFLQWVAARYMELILYLPQGPGAPIAGSLHTLYLNVSDPSVRQIMEGVDESYNITFAADMSSATVSAVTIFGARHGAETFSQLVSGDRVSGLYGGSGMNITDAPRFGWRGLLIDVSRHWLPPNVLLSIFDSMSYAKMNTLQVGFAIDWAWTVESLAWPNITGISYSPNGMKIYTQDTTRMLVAEANKRGIRIIPFIELVGHCPLGYQFKELVWCNGAPGFGLPHPLHNMTWDFFDKLWADYRGVFQDDYVNFGGDEFDSSCWTNDTEIDAWNAAHGYTGTAYITAYYYTKMFESMAKSGFKPIMFGDAFGTLNGTGVDLTGTDIIFDYWDQGTPGSAAPALMAPGARVLVSSYCFLVPTNACPDNLPNGEPPDVWSNYACELQNTTLFPPEAVPYLDKMLGGHASRWGEIADGTNWFQYTYPSAYGVAEKLWSPANYTNNASIVGPRQEVFNTFRCLLLSRGLQIESFCSYCWECPFEGETPYPMPTPNNPNTNSSWVWNYNNASGSGVQVTMVTPEEAKASIPCADQSAEVRALQQQVRELQERLAAEGKPVEEA